MKRTEAEETIVFLAKQIEAGRLSVDGSITLTDVSYSYLKTYKVTDPPQKPDHFVLKAGLDCYRINNEH